MIYPNRKAIPSFGPATLVGTELRVVNALLMVAGAVLCVAYVALAVATNSKTVQARGVKSRIAALREQQQKLEIDVAVGRSMEVIEGKVGELGLVPIDRIEYVNAGGGAVAVR